EQRARLDREAVHEDRARPALAGVAPDVRAGQALVVPQVVDQEPPPLDRGGGLAAVEPVADLHRHRPLTIGRVPPGMQASMLGGMLPSEYETQDCSVARALEILGERWTLLIVRDALHGVARYDEFLDRLGVPTTTLSRRLSQLVTAGVLYR